MHRSTRLFRTLLWMACGAALLLIVCAIFRPRLTLELRQAMLGERPVASAVADPVSDESSAASDGAEEDSGPQPFRSPLVRGLGQALDQGGPALDGAEDELHETLSTADALLTGAKQANREALRQVNRQIRLPGRSPQVVLILAPCPSGSNSVAVAGAVSAVPHLDRLAAQSMRLMRFAAGDRSSYDRARRLIFFSSSINADSETIPNQAPRNRARLSNWIWQSGYMTAVLGDCSWLVQASPVDHGFDTWIGFRTAEEAAAPYPTQIWHNGQVTRVIPGGTEGKRPDGVSLLQAEATSLLKSHDGRSRPLALLISLPAYWSSSQIDGFVGTIDRTLSEMRATSRTLLLFVGAGSGQPGGERADAGAATLLVRWPGRIPSGVERDDPIAYVDLSPTLADAVDALHGPLGSQGKSRWKQWAIPN